MSANGRREQPQLWGRVMVMVLLVDDDMNQLRALETLVCAEGYEVMTASNGDEALHAARRRRPDIVVSDFMMPVMDGPALIGALAAEPEFATIPVLLNSAVATPPPHLRVSAFLRKPVAASRLLELLQLHSSR
ncbi:MULTISPECIES: response regulator [Paraburkholderia]|uniref:response regulator n=1 Tax=Paraburkholderia TaxID=1822464 RepID=UPI001FB2E513|nr:response regulator [Paraburkholderia sp. BL9I2N2]